MGSVVGRDSASVEEPQSFGEVGQPFRAGINSVDSCRWEGGVTRLTRARGGSTLTSLREGRLAMAGVDSLDVAAYTTTE